MLSTSRSRRRHSSAIGQSQAVSPTLPVSSQAQTARAAPPQHPHGRHQRRRSIVVQRDLYANGERDAVRCRHGGLEGLDEILAMAPPVASGTFSAPSKSYSPLILSSRRGSAPAPSSSSSLPSTRSPAPSTSLLPSPGSPTSPPPATAPLVRARTLSGAVKRKPAPKVALEDDFDTVSDPRWDGRVVLPASSSGEPVAESLASRPSSIFISQTSAGRRDEQALLDAWMDLIVGGGAPEPETAPSVEDGAGRSSERPSARPLPAVALPSHAATCAGLNVRGAPAPLEPEALASLATSLPPLLYSTPSSALADLSFHQPAASHTNGPATSLISPSPASPLPAITRAIRRASIASLSCSDAASSEYHSALEPQGGCFDAEEDVDGRARAESAEPPSSLSSKPVGRVASLSSNSGSSVDGVKHDVAVAAVPVVVLL
ncbi:uncharacterized protein JCM10292_000332 [Rhodotorula paludigena]|uniref:uncharacterized protein n=1 Tax=Rhodotorula paludigena TaxID=86838 RepID=UPI0031773B5C